MADECGMPALVLLIGVCALVPALSTIGWVLWRLFND
jgi:hypothetical protein